MNNTSNPEIGLEIRAGGVLTNYHDSGTAKDGTVMLIHGSGPGVTAWANWRLTMPALAQRYRVLAPDMVGFGYTERPDDQTYGLDAWISHAIGFLDALEIDSVNLVGNSFGGGLALALAIRHPQRVRRLVLMGAVGVPFPLTPGLDEVWGYTPSFDNMRRLLDIFAFNRELVSDELAQLRYEASMREGVQEAYAAMFPAPRQRWIDALASTDAQIRSIPHEVLVVHGRDDKVIPLDNSLRFAELIERVQLHVFGRCGHWTQIEHAARFNRLVAEFFAET